MSRMRAAASTRSLISGFRELPQPQAERHVLEHRHMRVERVVLEHHRDVPVLRRHVVDQLIADIDLARGGFFEPGDHPQGRALAAARGSDQHDELAVGDVEVDPLHRRGLVEHLDDFTERDLRHVSTPLSRRRSGRKCNSPSETHR